MKIARPLTLILILASFFGAPADASGPPPPQPQQQPGQPITLEVDSHGSLFVDPLWSSGAQGTCRYLTNPSSSQWVVPIESQAEWQSMETSSDNQYSENYATQQVCCRPSSGAQNATLCASASGGAQSAQIVGQDPTGYGLLGSTGSATATCSNPPYGNYAETQTFTCILDPTKPSTGVAADGAWSTETSDSNTCQPNAYITYGACSASCGGGNIYETVYNSCGQITSQGYSGPGCNTQSCCTPDYEFSHCNNTTAVYTDLNNCGGANQTYPGACSLKPSFVSTRTCSPTCTQSVPDNCNGTLYMDKYHDCSCHPGWATCPPGTDDIGSCGDGSVIETICGQSTPPVDPGPICESCQHYSYQLN